MAHPELMIVASGSDGISQSPETERINQARANLPPIDSIFVINDFEVRSHAPPKIAHLADSQAVAKDLCPDAAWDYYSAAAETYSGEGPFIFKPYHLLNFSIQGELQCVREGVLSTPSHAGCQRGRYIDRYPR